MDRLEQLNDALAGEYRLERELGSGGMATVYLAEDVRHHRHVAIKVLRDDVSASVGTERFLREIEIAAQLQHPHILPLLDSGQAGGRLYYVMPFVEGHSLRSRLKREHELPIGEAVRMLVEIVDALAYAHAHGVVHRDIKPDNIMLSGRHALIADFGVARAISTATEGGTLTSLGVALGTPSYMSPEQATADPSVDQRTDLYSVGVMAYELIAGTLPFASTTPQKVLAAHVMETPAPVSKHRSGVAPALEAAIMRCLEKKPADRWQRADDLLAALEPLATPSGGLAPTSARLAPAPAARSSRWLWVAGLVAIAGAIAAYNFTRRPGPSLALGQSTQLTNDVGLQIHPALSPDGKFVAYASGTSRRMRIFIQPLGGGRVLPLSDDTTALQTNPRWSPDGNQLLALSNGGVVVTPALGGSVRTVQAGGADPIRSADWSPDGREIAFVRGDSLFIQPLDGKAIRFVGTGFFQVSDCHWQPSGKLIACMNGNSEGIRPGSTFGNAAPSAIVLFPVNGAAAYRLTDQKSVHQSPAWSADGDRLYFISDRDGTRDIYESVIGNNGQPRGEPMRLTTGLNAHSLSVAGTHLVYSVYSARANIWTLPIPQGKIVSAESATSLTNSAQIVESVRSSPDGKWLLFDATRSGRSDIYRMLIGGGAEERLVHESFDVFAPSLSPDGKLLAYHSWRNGTRDIEVKPLDGGPVEVVTSSPAQESYPMWSPDGRSLAFYNQAPNGVLISRRDASGRWTKPTLIVPGLYPSWLSNDEILYFTPDSLTVKAHSLKSGAERLVTSQADFAPSRSVRLAVASPDASTLFLKAHDSMGRASFWRLPAAGGTPQQLVEFSNPAHRSNRRDFGVDATHFFFTFEDQESHIWVADIRKP